MAEIRTSEPLDVSAENTLPTKFDVALGLLLEAFEYAEQSSGNHWEFAVEIQELRDAGLTTNDLRFIVRRHLVVHGREVTVPGNDGRDFQPTGDLSFTKRTCFVLTREGVEAARRSCMSCAPGAPSFRTPTASDKVASDSCVPSWDPEKRVLSFDGQVVKHFKWHAVNQEAILATFEEEGWPSRIDDPLTPQPGQDSKRRLSDTVKCLNRKQKKCLLHFRGDGTGEGVTWEVVDKDGSNGNRAR